MSKAQNEIEEFIYKICYQPIWNAVNEYISVHPTSLNLSMSRIHYPDTAMLLDMLLEYATHIRIDEDSLFFDAIMSCTIELQQFDEYRGDMSGEREKAINGYNELIDSLKIVNKGIAVTQAALEETENSLNNGEFDAKSYSSVFNTLDKLLARRESLISAITHYQGLIYKYSKIDQFMSRIQEIIIDHGGLTLWNTIYKSVQSDFILRELLKEIPKEEDKTMKIPAAKSITKKRKGN